MLQDAFECRFEGWTGERRRRVVEELSLADEAAADALHKSITQLIHAALYDALEAPQIEALFPADYHKKLRAMLASLVAASVPGWREACVRAQVSLPRLLDVSCEPFTTVASGGGAGAGATQAGALLRLRVEEPPQSRGSMAEVRDVAVSLDAAKLRGMVAELQQIRDQLSAFAGT